VYFYFSINAKELLISVLSPWIHTTGAEETPLYQCVKLFGACPVQDVLAYRLLVLVVIDLFNSMTGFCTFLILTLQIQMLWRKDVCLLCF